MRCPNTCFYREAFNSIEAIQVIFTRSGVENLASEDLKSEERVYRHSHFDPSERLPDCFGRHPARLPCPPGCILSSGSVDGAAAVSAGVRRKMLISSMGGDFKGHERIFLQFADRLHPAHPCSTRGVQAYGNL